MYAAPGNHEDRGIQPFVRVSEVKNADSHTDMRSWGYVQYGPTAMVFLPARTADVAGPRRVAPRRDPARQPHDQVHPPAEHRRERNVPRGYAVEQGQTIRVNAPDELAAAAYAEQLYRFDNRRLAEFAAQEVASPLANEYHDRPARICWRKADAPARRGNGPPA